MPKTFPAEEQAVEGLLLALVGIPQIFSEEAAKGASSHGEILAAGRLE